jgi:hypothetical protein
LCYIVVSLSILPIIIEENPHFDFESDSDNEEDKLKYHKFPQSNDPNSNIEHSKQLKNDEGVNNALKVVRELFKKIEEQQKLDVFEYDGTNESENDSENDNNNNGKDKDNDKDKGNINKNKGTILKGIQEQFDVDSDQD